jgi:DNA-binding winged helix-turn-helix (wHTH) protein
MICSVGHYRIDVERRAITMQGNEVHLSPKAFDVLAALLAARPRVLRKQELIACAWPDTYVSEANLAVIIAEIRQAFADPARSPKIIRTHHGVGYSFIAQPTELVRAAAGLPTGPVFTLRVRRRRILLDDTTLVGRDEQCDIVIGDASVSRRHARLLVEGSRVVVEDLQSKNGTIVDGIRISGASTASAGSELVFGAVSCRLEIERVVDPSTLTTSVTRNGRSTDEG